MTALDPEYRGDGKRAWSYAPGDHYGTPCEWCDDALARPRFRGGLDREVVLCDRCDDDAGPLWWLDDAQTASLLRAVTDALSGDRAAVFRSQPFCVRAGFAWERVHEGTIRIEGFTTGGIDTDGLDTEGR